MVHVVVTKPVRHVTADTLWQKLSLYSDLSWHPQIQASKNIGSIPDGSKNMVGAVRLAVTKSGKEVTETVRKWSNTKRYQEFSIDKGAPPLARSLVISFHVREDNDSNPLIDMIADVELRGAFCIVAPLLMFVFKKKLGQFLEDIANYKE